MSQTILIEPNQELNKIYSLNLSTYVGTDVIIKENAKEAIELLKILPTISLIITRNHIGLEKTSSVIHKYITEEFLDIPILTIGDNPEVSDKSMVITEPINWEVLITKSAKLLGVSTDELAKRVKPSYVPMAPKYFYDIKQTPCDVYIRISKGPGDYQFVKRIHSQDNFQREDIKKYEAQGLKNFYINKDYEQYFVTFVTNHLISIIEDEEITQEERIFSTSHGHEILADQINKIGLEDHLVHLAESGINAMVQSVRDTPNVSELLKFLFSNKISFAYQQCHLVTLMAQHILSKQNWAEPKHLEMLSFVAFFSDVTLKTTTQMLITSQTELEQSNLDEEEKKAVISHAKDAARLLEKNPEFEKGLKLIIMQHHGNETGVGFNDTPNTEINPLIQVYLVADYFVKILLNPAKPSAKREIIPLLYERFSGDTYQKLIKALEKKFQ